MSEHNISANTFARGHGIFLIRTFAHFYFLCSLLFNSVTGIGQRQRTAALQNLPEFHPLCLQSVGNLADCNTDFTISQGRTRSVE